MNPDENNTKKIFEHFQQFGSPGLPQIITFGGPSLSRSAETQQLIFRRQELSSSSGDVGTTLELAAEKMDDLSLKKSMEASSASDDKDVSRSLYGSGEFFESRTLVTKPANLTTKLAGQRVNLQVNYIETCTPTNWTLYKYRVDFEPGVDVAFIRKTLLHAHKEEIGGYIFDGSSLWTTNILCFGKEKFELISKMKNGKVIKLTVNFIGRLENDNDLHVRVYDMITEKYLEMFQLELVNRDCYDPLAATIALQNPKRELWPACGISLRQSDLLLSVEIRTETALNIIRNLSSYDQRAIKSSPVINRTVLSEYDDGGNRTYRIDHHVDFNSNPISRFVVKKYKATSFFDCHQQEYPINMELISDMRQSNKTIAVLPTYTELDPTELMEKLTEFNRKLMATYGVSQMWKGWNMMMSPDQDLVKLSARKLPIERIVMGDNMKITPYPNTSWRTNLHTSPMLVTLELKNWIVISHRGNNEQRVVEFVDILRNAARQMKFKVNNPKIVLVPDTIDAYSDAILKVFCNYNPQIILIIVPNKKSNRYSAIKLLCNVELGVPSQVLCMKNVISKSAESIATNVAVQMNTKLGGVPWTVHIPFSGLMVIGLYVCQDTLDKNKFYGSTVATTDSELLRYFSRISEHRTVAESRKNFSKHIIKAINRYREVNGNAFPNRIIIYRDGMGEEDQSAGVFEDELRMIKADMQWLYNQAGIRLKFAFVVVSKQDTMELFDKDGKYLQVGTVIDDVVTDPSKYDFYLISQPINNGTAYPTHYNVLHHNLDLDADTVKRLTYKLTHLYYNWTGTIRVPAPCQFAHKLAILTSKFLHHCVKLKDLENSLYFL